ncbi:MAG: hypothetical protein ACTS44_01345 [Candidatus Hodgkinia cicadicola]
MGSEHNFAGTNHPSFLKQTRNLTSALQLPFANLLRRSLSSPSAPIAPSPRNVTYASLTSAVLRPPSWNKTSQNNLFQWIQPFALPSAETTNSAAFKPSTLQNEASHSTSTSENHPTSHYKPHPCFTISQQTIRSV